MLMVISMLDSLKIINIMAMECISSCLPKKMELKNLVMFISENIKTIKVKD